MSRPEIFHIKNLVCRYPGSSRDILKINELIIPRGKLIFVLGSSGVGKSTLLETLGLMNRTAVNGTVNFFPAGEPREQVDFMQIWEADSETIDSTRKKHLSFIFQQTNLMENFSAYENLCLSRMIKEEVTLEDSIASSKPLLRELGLGDHVIDLERMPNLLSGGQRQRLAFVRALNNNAELILCDEPTGNLDEHNAAVVMSLLKNACAKGKTTLVVSHDIKLALAFADEIILVTKSESGYGEILLEHVFERKQWNENPDATKKLHEQIKASFADDSFNSQPESSTPTAQSTEAKIKHRQLFVKKEFKAIAGRKKFNLGILSVILLFTLLAAGFSNGSLTYLESKMNDPFINLVELIVPTYYSNPDHAKKIVEILEEVNKKNIKTQFNVESVSPYYIDWFSAWAGKNSAFEYKTIQIRTINTTNDKRFVSEFILADNNLVRGDKAGYKDSLDFRLIVTEDFLKDINYDISADYIRFRYKYSYFDSLAGKAINRWFEFPIGILAVTKALPGKFKVLMPDRMYFGLFKEEKKGFGELAPFGNRKFLSFISYDTSDATRKKIKSFISDNLPDGYLNYKAGFRFGSAPADRYQIDFNEPVDSMLGTYTFWDKMIKSPELPVEKMVQINDISNNDLIDYSTGSIEMSGLAAYFNKLDLVKEFDDTLKVITDYERFEDENSVISADISKIKEKQSYLFISTVSIISSTILLLFSVLSVSLFLGFLISNHLNKIKMNLGTFSAIGLSTLSIRQIYFVIIIRFISVALCIGFLGAFLLGWALNEILVSAFKSEQNMTYFNLLHPYSLIVAFIVLGSAILISQITIKKSLSKTPGDLIYNR